MSLTPFTAFKESTETVWIEPAEVASVREYQDRHAYSGNQPVSEICLKNGSKFKVCGHVANELNHNASVDRVASSNC